MKKLVDITYFNHQNNMCMLIFQREEQTSKEIIALTDACVRHSIPFKVSDHEFNTQSNGIVVGSIEFVQNALGAKIKPNYHPEWIQSYVHRKTWISKKWPTESCMVKSNDQYKKIGLVHSSEFCDEYLECGEYFCQEYVEVGNEWRIYVADGHILYCSWYKGPNDDKELTPITIEKIKELIPEGWCGTIDLMETENGIELCECHHPFSIGWYGDSIYNKIYLDFIVNGYKYIKNLLKTNDQPIKIDLSFPDAKLLW